jgi:hypothetical protein
MKKNKIKLIVLITVIFGALFIQMFPKPNISAQSQTYKQKNEELCGCGDYSSLENQNPPNCCDIDSTAEVLSYESSFEPEAYFCEGGGDRPCGGLNCPEWGCGCDGAGNLCYFDGCQTAPCGCKDTCFWDPAYECGDATKSSCSCNGDGCSCSFTSHCFESDGPCGVDGTRSCSCNGALCSCPDRCKDTSNQCGGTSSCSCDNDCNCGTTCDDHSCGTQSCSCGGPGCGLGGNNCDGTICDEDSCPLGTCATK